MNKRNIYFTEDALNDFMELPEELIDDCNQMLEKLKYNLNFGQRLYNMHGKDLRGCRKIYFNESKNRIVYRKIDDFNIEVTGINNATKAAEILGIGIRADEEIYETVARRLERLADLDDEDDVNVED